MKFKVDPNSELYQKLIKIENQFQETQKTINAYVKRIGGTAFSTNNFGHFIGQINGIQFEVIPDKSKWKSVGPKHLNLFMPKANQRKLVDEIFSLPTMDKEEYESLFNLYDALVEQGDGLGLFTSPGLKYNRDTKTFLLSVPNGVENFTPVDGMIEILESEYKKLLNDKAAEAGN